MVISTRNSLSPRSWNSVVPCITECSDKYCMTYHSNHLQKLVRSALFISHLICKDICEDYCCGIFYMLAVVTDTQPLLSQHWSAHYESVEYLLIVMLIVNT